MWAFRDQELLLIQHPPQRIQQLVQNQACSSYRTIKSDNYNLPHRVVKRITENNVIRGLGGMKMFLKRWSIVECEQIVEDEVCIDFKTAMPAGD